MNNMLKINEKSKTDNNSIHSENEKSNEKAYILCAIDSVGYIHVDNCIPNLAI